MLSNYEVQKALKPLKFIIIGGVLCVLDFSVTSRVNGSGFTFDFLNDLLGMIFITWGIFKLAEIEVNQSYSKNLGIVKIICILSSIKAFESHFIYSRPELLSYGSTLLVIAELVAMILFCNAMIQLAIEADLPESLKKWKVTRLLFIIIYTIPLGLFYISSLIAMMMRESFHINLGAFGLVLIPVFLAPIFYIFKASTTMREEISGLITTPDSKLVEI